MQLLQDYHVHTDFSPDGESDIKQCIESAKKNHVTDLIITDHFECNAGAIPLQYEQWPLSDPTKYYNMLVPYYNEKNINFGIGIELGQPLQNIDNANYFINAYNWDFILGSLHNIKNEFDFYFLDYSNVNIDYLFQSYFEELFEMVSWGKFDVLSHLFYFIKYIPQNDISISLNKYDSFIFDILKKCICNGIGIEVNTSSLRSTVKTTIPDLKYLKEYKRLGGELITVGSDSHNAIYIGYGCQQGIEIMKEAGFKYISKYKNRNPIQVKI